MAPRLEVFQWSDGFHAFTVAASSRPKALAAWGVGQDLFATGLAHEIVDGPDRQAALERPGDVIERGLTVDVGQAAHRRQSSPDAEARKRLAAAEAKWGDRQAQMAADEEDLERRIADLRVEHAALVKAHAAEAGAAEDRIGALQKALNAGERHTRRATSSIRKGRKP